MRVTPGSSPAACAASMSRFSAVRGGRAGVSGGEVQQHGAQERHRDADRADDHVLPRRLQRGPGAPVPDQEGGDDGGGLDRDPDDADVVGAHRQHHRGQKRRGQHAVEAGTVGVGVAVLQLGVDIADAGPGGQRADRRR